MEGATSTTPADSWHYYIVGDKGSQYIRIDFLYQLCYDWIDVITSAAMEERKCLRLRVMPLRSNLRLLLAQTNVKRAERNEVALSLRQLANETNISLSVLLALMHNRSKRIDYDTVDRLLSYFQQYMPVGIGDLLVWEPAGEQASYE